MFNLTDQVLSRMAVNCYHGNKCISIHSIRKMRNGCFQLRAPEQIKHMYQGPMHACYWTALWWSVSWIHRNKGKHSPFFPNWWLFSLQKNTKSEAVPIVWQNNDSECTQLQLKLFSSFPLYTPSVFSSALCSAAALRYALITDFSSIYLAVMTVIKSSSALKSNAKSSHPLALCCASCLLARWHPFLVVPHLSIDLLRCVSKPVVSCLNHGNFALMAHGHHLPTVGAYGQWAWKWLNLSNCPPRELRGHNPGEQNQTF